MGDLLDRMISGPRDLLRPIFSTPADRPPVLAITADLRLYASVLSAADSFGWGLQWARTISRGVETCWSMRHPIVIYDRDLPNVDWRCALDLLIETASHGRVLLAASSVDEDLWRIVLRRHGYDVLSKPVHAEQVRRDLRFAWLSMRETGEPAVEGSVSCSMARI
jgi:DNA-binding response OmpR family regulator